MKIQYQDLDIHEIENFTKEVLDEIKNLTSDELILDFTDVENVDLCFIQTLISIKKYCNNLGLDLVIENIDSDALKQYIEILNLNQTLGIMHD